MRRTFILALVALAAGIAVPVAGASQLIDRNATNVKLLVNKKGEALLTYTKAGKPMHVLAWGALNAIAPTVDANQAEFKLDYQGGWKKHYVDNPAVRRLQAAYQKLRKRSTSYLGSPVVRQLSAKSAFAKSYWKDSFGGSCPAYTGPKLAWFVTACTAPDGSLMPSRLIPAAARAR